MAQTDGTAPGGEQQAGAQDQQPPPKKQLSRAEHIANLRAHAVRLQPGLQKRAGPDGLWLPSDDTPHGHPSHLASLLQDEARCAALRLVPAAADGAHAGGLPTSFAMADFSRQKLDEASLEALLDFALAPKEHGGPDLICKNG